MGTHTQSPGLERGVSFGDVETVPNVIISQTGLAKLAGIVHDKWINKRPCVCEPRLAHDIYHIIYHLRLYYIEALHH